MEILTLDTEGGKIVFLVPEPSTLYLEELIVDTLFKREQKRDVGDVDCKKLLDNYGLEVYSIENSAAYYDKTKVLSTNFGEVFYSSKVRDIREVIFGYTTGTLKDYKMTDVYEYENEKGIEKHVWVIEEVKDGKV